MTVELSTPPADRQLPPLALDTGWRAALVLAAVSGAVVVVGIVTRNALVTGFAVAATIVAALLVLICALISRHNRSILRRLVNAESFAHWRYTEGEWARHLTAERKRHLPVTVWMLIFILAILVLASIGLLIDNRYYESQALPPLSGEGWRLFLIPLSIPIGILLAVGLIYDAAVVWHRRTMRRAGRCAYIGAEGLYFSGLVAYAQLRQGWKVDWVEGDPPSLRFEYFGHKNQQLHQIPVPMGREAEARAVLEKVRKTWPLDPR
jgi:hypothetical protein